MVSSVSEAEEVVASAMHVEYMVVSSVKGKEVVASVIEVEEVWRPFVRG